MSRRREARELAKALELSTRTHTVPAVLPLSSPTSSSPPIIERKIILDMSAVTVPVERATDEDVVGDSEGEDDVGMGDLFDGPLKGMRNLPGDDFNRSPPSSLTNPSNKDTILSFPASRLPNASFPAAPSSSKSPAAMPAIPTLDSIKSFSTTPSSRSGPSGEGRMEPPSVQPRPREGDTVEPHPPRPATPNSKPQQRRPKPRINPNFMAGSNTTDPQILAPATASSSTTHPTSSDQPAQTGLTILTPDQGPGTVPGPCDTEGPRSSQLEPTMASKTTTPATAEIRKGEPMTHDVVGVAARRRSMTGESAGPRRSAQSGSVQERSAAQAVDRVSKRVVQVEINNDRPSKRRIILSPGPRFGTAKKSVDNQAHDTASAVSPGTMQPRAGSKKSLPAPSISASERATPPLQVDGSGYGPSPVRAAGEGKGQKRKKLGHLGQEESESDFEMGPSKARKGKKKVVVPVDPMEEEEEDLGDAIVVKAKTSRKTAKTDSVVDGMDIDGPDGEDPLALKLPAEDTEHDLGESASSVKGKVKAKAGKQKSKKKAVAKPAPPRSNAKPGKDENFKSNEFVNDESDAESQVHVRDVEERGRGRPRASTVLSVTTTASTEGAAAMDLDTDQSPAPRKAGASKTNKATSVKGKDERAAARDVTKMEQDGLLRGGPSVIVAPQTTKTNKSGKKEKKQAVAPPMEGSGDGHVETGEDNREKDKEPVEAEEEHEASNLNDEKPNPPVKPFARAPVPESKPLKENRGFLIDKDGNVKEFKTARDDLPQVVAKSGGVKMSGFSRGTKIPSLHRKIKTPPKKLPPPPTKAQRKKGDESDDDEEFDEDGKKNIRKGDMEWYMQEDAGF